jgi:DNA-binding transcriptional LysR family regulator
MTPLLAVADRGCVRTIGVAWHRTRYQSPAARTFADFVIRHGAGPG